MAGTCRPCQWHLREPVKLKDDFMMQITAAEHSERSSWKTAGIAKSQELASTCSSWRRWFSAECSATERTCWFQRRVGFGAGS
jgi:hypothetical protein